MNLEIFICKYSAWFANDIAAAVTSSIEANYSSDAEATEVELSDITLVEGVSARRNIMVYDFKKGV